MFIVILPFGIMLSYSSHYFSSCHFQFLFCFESVSCLGASKNLSWGCDEYLKYSFYPYDLVSFSCVFMLNKCPNSLKVHTYDQVIHLVELYKIGGKTATEAAGEATTF